MMTQAIRPNSSPATAKTKSAMGVRQMRLHHALPRPAAEQTALAERLQAAIDLVAVADRRI